MTIKTSAVILICGIFTAGGANAALYDRGGGLLYDDVLNVTWLQDANYAQTSGYDVDGLMTWSNAKAWAADLVYAGYDGWRLPTTLQPDSSCVSNGSNVTAENCTGSELGNLFYKTLGNLGASNAPNGQGFVNTGLFVNLIGGHGYWSATEYQQSGDYAYYFHFASGFQAYSDKANFLYALAVRDGDVAAVPEPESYILFLSGLGLLGAVARRRKSN